MGESTQGEKGEAVNDNSTSVFIGVLVAMMVYGWMHPMRTDEALNLYYANGSRADYRADVATQTVRVRLHPSALYELSSCHVFDARNWQCKDEDYFVGATEGEVSVTGPPSEPTVSWLTWEWRRIRAWFAKLP
jgi:hypothetical protein